MGHRSPALLLALCLLPLLAGCSGCRSEKPAASDAKSAAERDAQERERKEREPFASGELKVLPADDDLAAYGAKPGHWVGVRNEWTSKRSDARLELAIAPVGLDGKPVPFGESGYTLEYTRPVALPKGQKKSFELPCFLPPASGPAMSNRNVVLGSELRVGGASVHDKGQLTNRLRPHQMHLVVLARRPDAFAYLKSLDSVRPRDAADDGGERHPDYVLVYPTAKSPLLLPSSSLLWTSIASILWDDVDPELLTKEQQEAMVEWLHWGGQLIVCGPSSLDSLSRSFLADYLPVHGGVIEKMSRADVDALDEHWRRSLGKEQREAGFPWSEQAALDVLRWSDQDLLSGEASATEEPSSRNWTRARAAFVAGTANLVAESRVGRGRIAVTAFSLSARPIVVWKSFDNFLNGCLLRRPGRSFPAAGSLDPVRISERWEGGLVEGPVAVPSGSSLPDSGADDTPAALLRGKMEQGYFNSRLRYFARDASALDVVLTGDQAGRWDVAGYGVDPEVGVAGWSDRGHVTQVALADLNRAAGIKVPDASHVLTSLAAYLLVLIPANWALFRAMGRVEWAWFAVPLLSLLGTFAVVRVARLDIGFSRSVTEVAVVEMQADLPRAHVTRFTGIYTALSEPFDLVFDRGTAVALPILQEGQRRPVELVDRSQPLPLKQSDRLGENFVLEGLAIRSNSTAMVRSEQVLTLEGPLRFTPRSGQEGELQNATGLKLRGVVVVRRDARGALEHSAAGDLAANEKVSLRFEPGMPTSFGKQAGEQGTGKAEDASADRQSALRIRHLLYLAVNPARIYAGDLKVVAWMDERLPGMKVRPETGEVNFRGMLLSHLHHGQLPAPDSDDNGPPETAVEVDHD